MAPIEELALLDFDRSNKGASKQRRDQINAEIAIMRDLLPLSESSRQRLSQLQIMSLTCVYIRKCNVLKKLFQPKSHEPMLPESLDFFQALTGFLLVTTREGKLLYISENVTDYLGHSMVDMKTQGDSLYDIVDKRDHGTVQAQLLQSGSQGEGKEMMDDVSFFCRMNMSRTLKRQSGFGDVKVMHVRGHFVSVNSTESGCINDGQSVFMATCSPLITPDLKENLIQNNTLVFKTVHQLDMTFLEVTKTAEIHLGCSNEDLEKKSWYSMLHPEDIHEAKEKHVQLIRSNHEMGCMMTVRMLRADGSNFWVNIVMHVRQASLTQNDEPLIVCINQVIDAREAYQIKVQGHMFYPSRAHEMWVSQMPAVTASNQDQKPLPWVQQNGSNSVPVPGYPANIPNYISQVGCPQVYQNRSSRMLTSSYVGKPVAGLSHFNAVSAVQPDQLKAMLKRKIQGPQTTSCKPAKAAKMNWDLDRASGGTGFSDIAHDLGPREQYRHVQDSSSIACSGSAMQVLQPSNYRIGVRTAKKSLNQVLSCQGMVSPVLTKSSSFISEQVVPDVNLPESYLTPDPSPVSSPQPSYITVKTEVMDPEEVVAQGKSSVNILQALQKLAELPQETKQEQVSILSKPVGVRQMQTSVSQRRKELPIFDAFDIDNFFDTLEIPEASTKASSKMEVVQIKHEVKTELPEEQPLTENMPNFEALKEDDTCSPFNSPYHSPISCTAAESNVHKIQPSSHSPLGQSYFPPSPEANTLSFSCPDVDANSLKKQENTCAKKKDLVVASMISSSPKSGTSQESIDELLSYFSDDGVDLSPLQMDSRSSILDNSANEDLLDDLYEKNYPKSYYMDSHCSIPLQIGSQRLPEELSPQSTTSSLAGEDDVLDETSTLTLGMALGMLDEPVQEEEVQQSSIKDREVLGMNDDLKFEFLLNSLVPSQGSLDVIKHGQ